jgi:cyanophycinase-like exopeptidase
MLFVFCFPYLVTRDRMGRMNTFMARILKDIDAKPPKISRGVGIDEHTALLLDVKTGDVQAVGK